MKSAAFATIALFIAAPALAADPVSLIGTWKGEEVGVGAQDGWDRHEFILEVGEQRETAFTGKKSYGTAGAYETEDIYGSMTPDGRIVVVVDVDGVFTGSLVGSDVLDLCYSEMGEDASAKCAHLTRQ